MHGIVLAAGSATRMPNKALMPIAGGRLAIESSLEFLRGLNTTVVVSKDSLIPHVLKMRGWKHLQYAVQPEPKGVVDAIKRVEFELACVTFCDNVYSMFEPRPHSPVATIRCSPNTDLDWHDGRQWCSRPKPESALAFAGWCVVQQHMLVRESLIECFNICNVQPQLVEEPWWDIGTTSEYERYLKSAYKGLMHDDSYGV